MLDPRYGPQEPAEENFSCFFGAGAFLSTASDMVRFGLAIKAGKFIAVGSDDEVAVLPPVSGGSS